MKIFINTKFTKFIKTNSVHHIENEQSGMTCIFILQQQNSFAVFAIDCEFVLYVDLGFRSLRFRALSGTTTVTGRACRFPPDARLTRPAIFFFGNY